MTPAIDPNNPLSSYLPLALALLLAGVLALVIVNLAALAGPKRPSSIKSAPFEAGSASSGTARQRFAVKFYVVALLFIVFDVEAVFLYPWAVNFQALGWFGYAEMVVFAATVVVGLIYIWKKGALEWEH